MNFTRLHRHILAWSFWVAAFTTMIFATKDHDDMEAHWAVLMGLGACFWSGWLLLENCHQRVVDSIEQESARVDRLMDAFSSELGHAPTTPSPFGRR